MKNKNYENALLDYTDTYAQTLKELVALQDESEQPDDFPYPHNLISMILNKTRLKALDNSARYSEEQISGLEYIMSAKLDERTLAMLRMWTRDGLSLTDIAEVFGISRQAVYANIQKAMRILRTPGNLIYIKEGLAAGQKRYEEIYSYEIAKKETVAKDPTQNSIYVLCDYGLTTRGYNCLYRAGIRTVKDVMKTSRMQLNRINGCGPRTRTCIANAVNAFNEETRKGVIP